MAKDPQKILRKAKAVELKKQTLNLVSLALLNNKINLNTAATLMMMVSNDPSLEGQEALNALVIKVIEKGSF